MAIRDDSSERTIEPTALRLAEARRKGVVARSGDLTAAAMTLGCVCALWVFAPSILAGLRQLTISMLDGGQGPPSPPSAVGALLIDGAAPVLSAIGGFALLVAVVALAANVLQVGLLAAPQRVKADWARISPLAGLKRMFSRRAPVRLAMALMKLAVVGAVGFATVRSAMPEILGASGMGAARMVAQGGRMVVSLALRIGLALLALGVVDYLYQRWQHRQDLKMTRREVQDELKDNRRKPATRRAHKKLLDVADEVSNG